MSPIRVLVVDDSTTMRRLVGDALSAAGDIVVVGEAADPIEARAQIKALNPDVVTLDVEMPHMDGVTFLEKLMRLRPTPVVMVSTLTAAGADMTLRALEIGAVDCVAKPADGAIAAVAAELVAKVRIAARARPRSGGPAAGAPPPVAAAATAGPVAAVRGAVDNLIALGASTGGVEALRTLFAQLPAAAPPIVVVQHMPAAYTARLATRLNGISPLRVIEARQSMALSAGMAAVAPGGRHMIVRRRVGEWRVELDDSPLMNGHKPSVDVLFRSLAASPSPQRVVAGVLTGMGRDGAAGAVALAAAGAQLFAQDEASCVVYGMPKAVVDACPAARTLPINAMAAALVAAAHGRAA